jgi:hypothetical protein
MAYTVENFKTLKAVREALKAAQEAGAPGLHVYQPGPFGPSVPDGELVIEGPHYPKPHRWYVTGVIRDGYLTGLRK